jgi:hypothetical protein
MHQIQARYPDLRKSGHPGRLGGKHPALERFFSSKNHILFYSYQYTCLAFSLDGKLMVVYRKVQFPHSLDKCKHHLTSL